MRIKMLTLDAGPKGVRRPGQVLELDKAEALELINARAAIECDAKGNPLDPDSRRERTVAPKPPETASKDRTGNKGKPPETASKDKAGEKPGDDTK